MKIRKKKSLFLKSQRFAKNKRATIVALMHLVLKEYEKIRSIKQMCQELKIEIKVVQKQLWILKTINNNRGLIKIKRKTSKDYLLEHAHQITNKKETLAFAKKVVTRIQKLGGNPISIAAGSLYYASKTTKNPISKNRIGKVFQISPRTVDTNERKIRNLITISANKKSTLPPMRL